MASTNLQLVLSLVDQVSGEMKKVQQSVGKNFDSIIDGAKKVGTAMTVAGTAITGGLTVAVQEAGKAEGAIAKFNTVFGEHSDDMMNFVKDIRERMPTATHEIIAMASGIQDMLVPMGLSRGMATEMTQGFLEVANQIGAFNDVDPSQVLLAINSGLRGSAEPLTAFGINANVASLEAKALKMGLLEAGQSLVSLEPEVQAQVRAQALLAQILDNSSDAINGFAENNDSYLRRQQELTASIKDSMADIGEVLLPIYDQVLKKVLSLVEALQTWKEENPQLFETIVKVVAIMGALMVVLGPILIALPLIISGVKAMIAVFTVLAGPVGIIIAIIGLLVLAVMNLIEIWNLLKIIVPQVWEIIQNAINEKVNQIKERFETFKTNVSEIWSNTWESLRQSFEDLWQSIKSPIQTAFDWLESMFKKIKNTVGSIGSAVSGAVGAVTGIFKKDGNRAIGGPVNPNSSYLVGENGPEIFTPSSNGRIGQMGGGGVNVNVTVSGNTISNKLDLRDLANQVGDQIIKDLRLAYRV